MSSIATGIIAGVAQTAHNAQRVARDGDSRARERSDAERAERAAFEARLSSAGATQDADEELPDKPPPFYERLWQGDAEGQAQPANEQPTPDAKPDPTQFHLYDPHHPAQPTPLYRHLDIKA